MDLKEWTKNPQLIEWIKEKISLCKPDRVHLCDGTEEEFDQLMDQMEKQKKVIRLKRENSFLFRSHIDDVARVEEATFICSDTKEETGPTNNWKDPYEMRETLQEYFSGSMRGRTMYVIPFCMGPIGSDKAKYGVQITDSAYVVCNMKIMARIGNEAIKHIGDSFIPCMHSVGAPLEKGEEDQKIWPCNPQKRCIVHFPKEKEIWSYGSGYGGNALLGKKCLALRIASVMGKEEGWLAEHMLILAITNPQGEKKYFAAAFPSGCGKTNLAMMLPTLKDWKIECIGDDIAWMKFGPDGKLYAINPEAGFFGIAPGTSDDTNYNVMQALTKNAIFTNVALTKDLDVWWEGMSKNEPKSVTSWLGEEKKSPFDKKVAHPNARFTVSVKQSPVIDEKFNDPQGVPISAIIFGGRRDDVIPLVYESFSWSHGVLLGASVSSQKTAAAKGDLGKLRHDPFAMLPFCGYHMGDYFQHWLNMKEKTNDKNLPKIFNVNWFVKDEMGEFIWPGFGENIHVLKWMFNRIDNSAQATKTPIGNIPKKQDLLLTDEDFDKLFSIDRKKWLLEIFELEKYFSLFQEKFPKKLKEELDKLKLRLLEGSHEDSYSESVASQSDCR